MVDINNDVPVILTQTNERINEMTPFEEAGYTKDTKFKVLTSCGELRTGDIVTLSTGLGNIAPYFISADGRIAALYLPNTASYEELEVYVEEGDDGISIEDITQAEVNAGNIKYNIHEWLGEEGSQRYNLIRTLCKVMDGDKCKEPAVLMDDYQGIHTCTSHPNPIVKCATILRDLGRVFTLQSEDKEVIEEKRRLKLAKIKEVEDTLAKLKEEMEDL